MGRFFFCLSVLLGGISVAASTVEAQTPPANGQQIAEKAKRDHDLGRLNEAIDGYAEAYQLTGDSNLLFSLAEAHREAGHAVDAIKIFQTYLRRDPQGTHHESAEKQIKELERAQKAGAGKPPVVAKPVAPPAPAPVVAKPVAPPAPAPVVAKPVAPPAPAPVVAKPVAPPAPPPVVAKPVAPPAPAPVVAKPVAPLAPAPVVARPATPPPPPVVAPPPAPAPPPQLAAPAPTAGEPNRVTTIVVRGAEAPPAQPAAGTPLPRWVPWVLAATTVALGTGAIVSGLSASNRYDELRGSCGQTTDGCAGDQIDDVKSRALRANILWALAGVAAVGTGVTVYVNTQAAGVSGLWSF